MEPEQNSFEFQFGKTRFIAKGRVAVVSAVVFAGFLLALLRFFPAHWLWH
jgi:hypothetical protein